MLRQQLEQRKLAEDAKRQKYLEGLERIQEHRNKILERRGGQPIDIEVVELINQMREDRDAQILRAITDFGG